MLRTLAASIVLASIASCRAGTETDATPPSATDQPAAGPTDPDVGAPCDAAALRASAASIAQQWSSWSPASGTVPEFSLLAIAAVWTHCPGLPREPRLLLDGVAHLSAPPSAADRAAAEGRPAPATTDDPLHAILHDHASWHDDSAEAQQAQLQWHTSACPNFPAVGEAQSHVAAAERDGILWDRCLAHANIVTREEFTSSRRGGMGTVGLALHRWLTTDAKIEESTATPLARAIVLNGHWLVRPPDGLLLPAAEAPTHVEDGPVLYVGPTAAELGGRRLVSFDGSGALPTVQPKRGDPIVGEIFDALAEEADKRKELEANRAQRTGKPQPTTLLVAAHRDLTWATLRPVLASAALAGFDRVALLVLANTPPNPLRVVVVHDGTVRGAPRKLDARTTAQQLVATANGKSPQRLVR